MARDPASQFIAVFELPCPYRDRCPYGRTCVKRGVEVVQCHLFEKFSREEEERFKKLIRKAMRNGLG